MDKIRIKQHLIIFFVIFVIFLIVLIIFFLFQSKNNFLNNRNYKNISTTSSPQVAGVVLKKTWGLIKNEIAVIMDQKGTKVLPLDGVNPKDVERFVNTYNKAGEEERAFLSGALGYNRIGQAKKVDSSLIPENVGSTVLGGSEIKTLAPDQYKETLVNQYIQKNLEVIPEGGRDAFQQNVMNVVRNFNEEVHPQVIDGQLKQVNTGHLTMEILGDSKEVYKVNPATLERESDKMVLSQETVDAIKQTYRKSGDIDYLNTDLSRYSPYDKMPLESDPLSVKNLLNKDASKMPYVELDSFDYSGIQKGNLPINVLEAVGSDGKSAYIMDPRDTDAYRKLYALTTNNLFDDGKSAKFVFDDRNLSNVLDKMGVTEADSFDLSKKVIRDYLDANPSGVEKMIERAEKISTNERFPQEYKDKIERINEEVLKPYSQQLSEEGASNALNGLPIAPEKVAAMAGINEAVLSDSKLENGENDSSGSVPAQSQQQFDLSNIPPLSPEQELAISPDFNLEQPSATPENTNFPFRLPTFEEGMNFSSNILDSATIYTPVTGALLFGGSAVSALVAPEVLLAGAVAGAGLMAIDSANKIYNDPSIITNIPQKISEFYNNQFLKNDTPEARDAMSSLTLPTEERMAGTISDEGLSPANPADQSPVQSTSLPADLMGSDDSSISEQVNQIANNLEEQENVYGVGPDGKLVNLKTGEPFSGEGSTVAENNPQNDAGPVSSISIREGSQTTGSTSEGEMMGSGLPSDRSDGSEVETLTDVFQTYNDPLREIAQQQDDLAKMREFEKQTSDSLYYGDNPLTMNEGLYRLSAQTGYDAITGEVLTGDRRRGAQEQADWLEEHNDFHKYQLKKTRDEIDALEEKINNNINSYAVDKNLETSDVKNQLSSIRENNNLGDPEKDAQGPMDRFGKAILENEMDQLAKDFGGRVKEWAQAVSTTSIKEETELSKEPQDGALDPTLYADSSDPEVKSDASGNNPFLEIMGVEEPTKIEDYEGLVKNQIDASQKSVDRSVESEVIRGSDRSSDINNSSLEGGSDYPSPTSLSGNAQDSYGPPDYMSNFQSGNGSAKEPFILTDEAIGKLFQVDPKTNEVVLKDNWEGILGIDGIESSVKLPKKEKILDVLEKQGKISDDQKEKALKKDDSIIEAPDDTDSTNEEGKQSGSDNDNKPEKIKEDDVLNNF